MWGLKELGIPGPQAVRDVLCADPANLEKDIDDFQVQNGVLLPSLQPAMFFLNQHGVRRLDFHKSALEELRTKLVKRIEELAASGTEQDLETLKNLLEKSFPVRRVPHMRPVVLSVLEHLPAIDRSILDDILADKDLFNEVAMSVRQQIWTTMPGLFAEALKPLFAQFVVERENVLFGVENAGLSFFNASPKVRRLSEPVIKLVQMIGKNVQLFGFVCTFLKLAFMTSHNRHYCTLQMEVLMSFHGIEHNPICSSVPVHKFAWAVDACIREHYVSPNLGRELQAFLDGMRKGQESVLGDLAVVLSDPHATHMLLLSVMRELLQCINTDTLPRETSILHLLFRLLGLGVAALEMNNNSNYKEPKMDPHLFTKFLPTILGLMVDDQVRGLNSKTSESASSPLELPTDLYAIHIKSSTLASLVAMYYVLQLARQRDKAAITVMLPTLLHCEHERPFEDCFLHALISALIACGEDFETAEFANAVFDDFLLPMVFHDNTKRHILRLLWHVFPHLPKEKLESILEAIASDNAAPAKKEKEKPKHAKEKPSQKVEKEQDEEEKKRHRTAVVKTLEALKNKIASYVPEPAPAPETVIDSPLLGVPAATPMPL